MPLLKKTPFERQQPPEDLDPEEELFYCRLTNEVFRDYEDFFERVILCNSLVWTCELTGRPGLTYQEALDWESKARQSLETFPESMKRPLLFMASLTKRGRLADMCDDLFAFVRSRFLKGEEVKVALNGQSVTCRVVGVTPPSLSVIKKQKASDVNEDGKNTLGPDPSLYKYEVQEVNGASTTLIVSHADICRKKGSFVREKNKLFLKQYCEPRSGIWQLKTSTVEKFKLAGVTFSDVFAGSMPSFVTTLSGKLPNLNKKISALTKMKPKKLSEVDQKFVEKNKELSKDLKPCIVSMEDFDELRRKLEERRRNKEMEKQKRKEDREKERDQKREERRLKDEQLRQWMKPRDDLQCDDLKDIPAPIPVKCRIPNELFGDAVMILEFMHSFGPLFEIEDFFPDGISLDHLERALEDTDIQSPLGDIFQFLMRSLYSLQESEEIAQDQSSMEVCDMPEIDDDSDMTLTRALQAAAGAAGWSMRHQGLSLNNVTLDNLTISEVVRLHLLSLGGQSVYTNWRNISRGGYTIRDDPALQLRLQYPALLKTLSSKSLFDCTPGEKLQLMDVLINQLLTFMCVRDRVEETLAKIRSSRLELKHLQWAELRQEREDIALRAKKLEEKVEQEKAVQDNENNNNATNVSAPPHESEDETKVSAEELKMKKKEAHRKREFHQKEQEMNEALAKLQNDGPLLPLGRDRAYRKFWAFVSVPGLFVEDDDPFIEVCPLEPTPFNPKYSSLVDSGNKENDCVKAEQSDIKQVTLGKNHKLLSDNHPTVILEKSKCLKPLVLEDKQDSRCGVFGMCTGKADSCPVHSDARHQRPRWSFYCTAGQLDKVFYSLNPRGFREGALRDMLTQERPRLVSAFSRCPTSKLNPDVNIEAEETDQEIRKTRRNVPVQPTSAKRTPQHPQTGASAEEELESSLREMLLDIEDRTYVGSLGFVSVSDRDTWRDAIAGRSYMPLCEGLKWGSKADNKFLDVDSDSGRGTPMDLSDSEHQRSSSPLPTNHVVKDLASALLQIEQSIDPKYLQPPLGTAEKRRLKNPNAEKKREEEKKEINSDASGRSKTLVERWEESLMMCTSFSQIFVHLSTLERSIAWSKSALNARCRICRRVSDAENMLLCDDCNRGHHIYCLKPPLKEIPEDDWYCSDCRPHQPLTKIRKFPSKFSSGSEDEDYEETEDTGLTDGNEEDSEYDVEEEDEEADDSEGSNQDICEVCDQGGNLICCDTCPLSYHLECVDPPLRRVPRGKWECPRCANAPKTRKSSRTQPPPPVTRNLRTTGKRPALDLNIYVDESPAKRTRSSEKPVVESDDDEIWLSGRRKQGPAVRRGASRDVPVDYKLCDQVLVVLSRHECNWPFLKPVGRKRVPQYYEVVKRPIDLATMRGKLSDNEYRTTKDFLKDVLLMFQNCRMYNSDVSPEYEAVQALSNYFESYVCQMGYVDLEDLLTNGSVPSSPEQSGSSSISSLRHSRRP